MSSQLPGRAGGDPPGPPTDPDVCEERIQFLGSQSLGTPLAHHWTALHSQSDVVDDFGCRQDIGRLLLALLPTGGAVDLALITYYDELLGDVERTIVNTAKHHDANTHYLLQTVPGIGKILRLVLLYEIHDVHRFPRVQGFVSYGRLVTCAREAAGKR